MITCWPDGVCLALELWPVRFKTLLSPLRVRGDSSYTFSSRMVKDQKPNVDQMSTTGLSLNKEAKGFVWKPWMVRWDAMLALSAATTQRKIFASQSGEKGGSDSLVRRMNADYNVLVFPSSRFPFKTFYSRTQADTSEGEEGGRGNFNEEIGFSQNYRDKDQTTKVSLDGIHSKSLSGVKRSKGIGLLIPGVGISEGSSEVDSLTFSAKKRLLKHMVDVLGRLAKSTGRSSTGINENIDSALVVNHGYGGAENWSVNTMGNLSNSRFHVTPLPSTDIVAVEKGRDMIFFSKQISSFLSWRSKSQPVVLSVSSRIAQNKSTSLVEALTDESTKSESVTDTTNVSVRGSYDFSDSVRFGGNLSGNRIGNSFDDGEMSVESFTQNATMDLNAAYSPEGTLWGPFSHFWFVTGSMDRRIASNSIPQTNFKESLGQSLSTTHKWGRNVTLGISLDENSRASQKQGSPPVWQTSHSLSGSVNRSYQTGQASVALSLTDTRDFGLEKSDAQVANLQFSSNGALWKDIVWQGNVTVQKGRASSGGKVEITESSMAGVNLSFQRPNLFGVKRLRFASKLGIDVNGSLLPLGMFVGYKGKEERRNWWNTLEYQIGRMSARLTAGGTETDSDEGGLTRNGLVLFEMKRFFETAY